jgi:hypothetical protein
MVDWFDSKEFSVQIVILSLVFDVSGALLGYLSHSIFEIEPIMGIVYGIVVGNVIVTLWILKSL